MTPWVGNKLELPLGWWLQVENQRIGHWQPLKKNQGLIKVVKIPKGGKRPRKKWINSICEEAGHFQVCGERILELSCCYEHCRLSVRREELVEAELSCCYEHCWVSVRQEENCWNWRTLLKRSFQVHPHGFMVRLGGESGKWLWLPCSTVGRNVVVSFVFSRIGFRYVDLPLSIMNGYVFISMSY